MKSFKKILYILFFLLVNISYGQNYYFNKIVQSEYSNQYFPNQKSTDLFNSEDGSYYMQIYSRNDSLVSRIFDNNKGQVHHFYVDKADSLKLNFIKTISVIKVVRDYTFEFSEIKKKKGKNKITFKILNKKKQFAKYKFIIKETDQNLLSIFKLSALESLLFTDIDIVPPTKFIVLKAKGGNIRGNYMKYELKSIEDINLIIKIPK